MIIAIISGLGNSQLNKCVNSLLNTINKNNIDIKIYRERDYREESLNDAIKDTNDDVLIVGDDIIFTKGWFESLLKNYNKADILGFSNLYPGSKVIQDEGYDLVEIDNEIKLQPYRRSFNVSASKSFSYRSCDTISGCLFLIKKKVIKSIPEFNKDGKNRWGEFIYTILAKKKGYKVGVLGHYVYHAGIGTKNNQNLNYSSQSYSMEKDLWKKITKKYASDIKIKKIIRHKLSTELLKLIESSQNILLFGAGSVSEYIINKNHENKFSITSGFKEEYGHKFLKITVINISRLYTMNYDLIIITVLMKGQEIYKKYFKNKILSKNCIIIAINENENYTYEYSNVKR